MSKYSHVGRANAGERRSSMSYVAEKRRNSPVGMAAAVLVNGSIILAVALSPLVVEPRPEGSITVGRNIPDDPPPPEIEKPQDARDMPLIFVPKPLNKPLQLPVETASTSDEVQLTTTVSDGVGGGDDVAEIVREIVKPPVPPFTAAARDPRFARNFQPDYPVGMLQREVEGMVTLRVLIGIDGRVRQVQILNATTSDFARATERQALTAWRFKPATRGGEAVEDWQTLTVRFDIN